MPFTIREVVTISEKLRDVTIGLIYMINPDVKTLASSEMHKPWLHLCQVKTCYQLTVFLEVFNMISIIQKVKQGRAQRHCSFVFTVNTFDVFIYLFDF